MSCGTKNLFNNHIYLKKIYASSDKGFWDTTSYLYFTKKNVYLNYGTSINPNVKQIKQFMKFEYNFNKNDTIIASKDLNVIEFINYLDADNQYVEERVYAKDLLIIKSKHVSFDSVVFEGFYVDLSEKILSYKFEMIFHPLKTTKSRYFFN